MTNDVAAQVDSAVSRRRTELQALSLHEVGREFQATFQIQPDLAAGKDGLIERVLAKFRAELARKS
jgi:hypothetical protein